MSNFSLDLSRLCEKAKEKTELAVKKVVIDMASGVVLKSPVDTGRFRANWTISQGSYSTAAIEGADPSGAATIGAINAEVGGMKLDGQTIYLTNSLPYAMRLEYGWSKQAPAGVVRTTIAEISTHYGS